MRRWLKLIGQDWSRAPISGTAVIMANIAAAVLIYRGDVQFAIICLIYGKLTLMERGPFYVERKSSSEICPEEV